MERRQLHSETPGIESTPCAPGTSTMPCSNGIPSQHESTAVGSSSREEGGAGAAPACLRVPQGGPLLDNELMRQSSMVLVSAGSPSIVSAQELQAALHFCPACCSKKRQQQRPTPHRAFLRGGLPTLAYPPAFFLSFNHRSRCSPRRQTSTPSTCLAKTCCPSSKCSSGCKAAWA